MYWHRFWKCNGSTHNGDIELCRITRARYHRFIRQVECDAEVINMERMAQTLMSNRSRDIWPEAYKIKGHNYTVPCSVDGAKCDLENGKNKNTNKNNFILHPI